MGSDEDDMSDEDAGRVGMIHGEDGDGGAAADWEGLAEGEQRLAAVESLEYRCVVRG
jgi:hypothetical protein